MKELALNCSQRWKTPSRSIRIKDSSLAERNFPIRDLYPLANTEVGLAKCEAIAVGNY